MYSAYLDVVGLRDLAKVNVQDFHGALRQFQKWVWDICKSLSEDAEVFFFSDSAFAQAHSHTELVRLLTELRFRLMEEEHFFKAAIAEGDLDWQDASDYFAAKDSGMKARVKNVVKGYYFGEHAAQLFSSEDSLKGIGIRVVGDKLQKALKESVVVTCHLPDMNSRQPEAYKDLRFEHHQLTAGLLHIVLEKFFHAKMSSKKYGRYYIPLLIVWIQSMDLRTVDPRLTSDADLASILLNGSFERLFHDVVGVEQIYFALLNRVVSDNGFDRLANATFRYVQSRPWIINRIGLADKAILGYEVRHKCLTELSKKTLRTPEMHVKAVEMIRELRQAEKSDSHIAVALEKAGIPRADGRKWNASAVSGVRKREGIA